MSHRFAAALLAIAAGALASTGLLQAAPPSPAATRAATPTGVNARPFAIGALQAFALRDGTLVFPNDNKVFGVGHSPEEVSALLHAAGLPADALRLGLQPLLVKTTGRVLLFDTGAGAHFHGQDTGHLPAALAAAHVAPGSITDIFISHAHGDHLGGLLDAKGALAFPNATIHLSATEWAWLSAMDADAGKRVGLGNLPALLAAIKPKIAPFAADADIVPGVVKAVAIPGHTPGHSGYLIGSGADTLLYVGDALHHYVVSVQHPEWTNGFDADPATAAGSRAKLLQQLAASRQRVYAVHFPFPGVGRIQRQGEGYVWVAE